MQQHERFMQRALELAHQAEVIGEVPVGAVVVADNKIIGEGFNEVIRNSDPSAHAEAQAIRAAGRYLNNYRLVDTTLYVTLEPCAMCAGLITHARIKTLVFAAKDPRTGATGTAIEVLNHSSTNHKVEIFSGLLEQESATLLQNFFREKREIAKKNKRNKKV
ncbi:tRNA adenosine(34) deaminase TadA [Pseudidiomarina insulisalsae]|uniref:tRNA-specific adenosine deaminase n=1 Tax=Pseudidiomarina insulisalsae TaxID=575789 RepID=A0A432YAK5_9GAMM|nr:tRNA adenosine(34) deaminase TadA [Pseudidiomarina insulisalsae]RUO57952.1 tRNA adenosine(34) deaminase TadA [Pseudidiomarina insulisalsae]